MIKLCLHFYNANTVPIVVSGQILYKTNRHILSHHRMVQGLVQYHQIAEVERYWYHVCEIHLKKETECNMFS